MHVIALIRSLLLLYFLALLLHLALPYLTKVQRPWMAVLARICEPGVRIGNLLAAKLLPNRRFKIDMGPLIAAILCYILQGILGFFG